MNTRRFLALLNTLIFVSTLSCTLKPEKYTEKKEFGSNEQIKESTDNLLKIIESKKE